MDHTCTPGCLDVGVWSSFRAEVVGRRIARFGVSHPCRGGLTSNRIPSGLMTRATGVFVCWPTVNTDVSLSLRIAGTNRLTRTVSSEPSTTPSGGMTPWNSLTRTRQRLLKAIAHLMGDSEFTRRELEQQVDETDLSGIVDDQDLISVRTGMLNNLVSEDNYLVKTHQSDRVPFVLYVGGEDSDDETLTGLRPSELRRLVEKVLRLHRVEGADLEHIDFADIGDVVTKVNALVGKTVFIIVSDPNVYRLHTVALERVEDHLETG